MSGGTAGTSIYEILTGIASFVSDRIMPLMVGIAIIVFLFNMISFIANSGNEKQREQFKNYMINSVIAMFILISIWGIVGIGTKGLFGTKPYIPQLPTSDR